MKKVIMLGLALLATSGAQAEEENVLNIAAAEVILEAACGVVEDLSGQSGSSIYIGSDNIPSSLSKLLADYGFASKELKQSDILLVTDRELKNKENINGSVIACRSRIGSLIEKLKPSGEQAINSIVMAGVTCGKKHIEEKILTKKGALYVGDNIPTAQLDSVDQAIRDTVKYLNPSKLFLLSKPVYSYTVSAKQEQQCHNLMLSESLLSRLESKKSSY